MAKKKAMPHTAVAQGDPFWTQRGAYEIAGRRGIDPGTVPLQTQVPPSLTTRPAAERTHLTGDDLIHVKQPGKKGAEKKFQIKPRTVPITVRGGTEKPDR
jgi:hypothetical protein